MRKHACWIGAGTAVLALGIAVLTTGTPGQAANLADLKAGLPQLAASINSKKPPGGIDKMVAALAKDTDKGDLMTLFNPRSHKTRPGLGVGPKSGAITPDGIEVKIKDMAKNALTPIRLRADADGLIEMAYVSAAGAKVTRAIADAAVPKNVGKWTKADWIKWSEDTETASMELAAALASAKTAAKPTPKQIQAIKEAADKLDIACLNCHGVFKPK